MTVPATARRAGPYSGNGVTTSFSFSFKTFAAGDLLVTRTNASGIETALVLNSDYSVTLNGDQDASPGGSITYPLSGSALPAGQKLTIVGDLEYEQTTDLLGGGSFNARVIEDTFDRATIQIQQLEERADRALTLPVSSTASPILPAPEASKIIGWDVNGTGMQNYDIPDLFSGAVYADWIAETFTGTGAQTLYILQRAPGAVGNCDVSIAGVTQVPNVDFTLSGNTVSFTTPPANGLTILVRYGSAATQVSSTFSTETAIATAAQTVFNLASVFYVPGVNAMAVYVNGLRMVSGVDYLETSTTRVTFTSGLTQGDEVLFIAGRTINDAIDSSSVSFLQAGSGAVTRTAQAKMRETVSVKDFGAVGDGSDEYNIILAAWNYCLANGKDLYFPAGTYSSGINNMPFKNPTFPATSLLDCKNITIYGDGPNTILKSDSVVGADVLNLYSVKNLHIRNMKITADLSGTSGAGSNGCSIVGGFDNLTFDSLWFENLPYVEKLSPDYLDGGKAFTIQTGTPAEECGTVNATHIYVNGCVYGFGLEVDLVNFAQKKHAISIDMVAENCYTGVLFSAGAATGPLSSGMTTGLRVNAQLVNCQQNVVLGRAHGVQINSQIITTKTIADRRLNPNGGAWASFDSVVVGLVATYAKNSQISMVGDISNCDYIARIGATSDPSSGLGGQTDQCQFFIDVEGIAAVTPIELVNFGGNTINNSNLFVTTQTVSSLPTGFYTPALNNTITIGPSQRLISPTFAGTINFAYTDGITAYNFLERDGFSMFFKQTGGSSTDLEVMGVKNHLGAKLFFIRNDGYIGTAGRATASAVATIKGVLPIYDQANALYGYVPVYTSYTP